MTEALELRPATFGLDLPRTAGFAVAEVGGQARWCLRGGAALVARCTEQCGFDLGQPINRAAARDGRASLRLGPDEWLLLAPADAAASVTRQFESCGAGRAHALVDVSHASVTLEVRGPAAVDALASACPLPLSLARFPPDRCTRTLFARAGIVLWRRGPEHFELHVQRSYVSYVVALLQHEARAG